MLLPTRSRPKNVTCAMVLMMLEPVRRSASGASCLAMLRTRMNPSVSVLPAGTVPVAAPSNSYGTSTPGVLRPSDRMYLTGYWVIVTSLFVVGCSGVVLPISFSDARSVTCPLSPKIVGHGLVGEHGNGCVTLVMTSEKRVSDSGNGVAAPRMAFILSITRYTGELP